MQGRSHAAETDAVDLLLLLCFQNKKSRACICCLKRVTSRMPLTAHETYSFVYREDQAQVNQSTVTACWTPQSINK